MGSLWNRSGTIERFADDLRAPGAQAYFFSGGTTTPLTVYQDSAETSPHPHPVEADSAGRWPDIFIPYTLSYDVQVKTAEGVQLTYSVEIPNPDPVELTVTPPASGTVETGMIHPELINGTKTGYVRLNGRTMGNGSSSATERANADTQLLFIYLWTNLSNTVAAVSGGRGGSAAADFAANKTITLPDARGAVMIGLDDMGASAGSFFSGLTFTAGSATVAGSRLGNNSTTLTEANLAAHSHGGTTGQDSPSHTHSGTTGTESQSHTHSGTTGNANADHSHSFSGTTTGQSADHTHTTAVLGGSTFAGGGLSGQAVSSNTGGTSNDHTHNFSGNTGGISATHQHAFTSGSASVTHTHTITTGAPSVSHTHTFNTDSKGSSTAFSNVSRSVLITWYIKL